MRKRKVGKATGSPDPPSPAAETLAISEDNLVPLPTPVILDNPPLEKPGYESLNEASPLPSPSGNPVVMYFMEDATLAQHDPVVLNRGSDSRGSSSDAAYLALSPSLGVPPPASWDFQQVAVGEVQDGAKEGAASTAVLETASDSVPSELAEDAETVTEKDELAQDRLGGSEAGASELPAEKEEEKEEDEKKGEAERQENRRRDEHFAPAVENLPGAEAHRIGIEADQNSLRVGVPEDKFSPASLSSQDGERVMEDEESSPGSEVLSSPLKMGREDISGESLWDVPRCPPSAVPDLEEGKRKDLGVAEGAPQSPLEEPKRPRLESEDERTEEKRDAEGSGVSGRAAEQTAETECAMTEEGEDGVQDDGWKEHSEEALEDATLEEPNVRLNGSPEALGQTQPDSPEACGLASPWNGDPIPSSPNVPPSQILPDHEEEESLESPPGSLTQRFTETEVMAPHTASPPVSQDSALPALGPRRSAGPCQEAPVLSPVSCGTAPPVGPEGKDQV